jgi:hypothetical protein
MEETESIDVQNQAVILAYVKRGEDPNTILFSDDARRQDILKLFNDPYIGMEKIHFDGKTPVDEGECYEVNLSQNGQEMLERQYITSMGEVSSLSDYEPTGSDEETNDTIRVIYKFDGKKLVFKRIPKNQQLRDSMIIRMDGEPTATDMVNVLAIDERVDAVYNVVTHQFYFADFQAAKHVFGPLEVYYRSATQDEVDEWLDPSVFDIDSSFDTFAISTPNRKKMTYASEQLGIDLANPETLGRIAAYAGKHAPKMLFINGKFNIKKNADLTEALRLISGSYYENEITGMLMVANTPKKAK